MAKCDFTVIVLCYKPDIDKLYNTLYSIITQKNVSYEVIITDDGSGMDYKNQVANWFDEQGFSDYKLVFNEKNQGTVKNLLSGLEVAEGRYSKNISPGDYLYEETSLEKMCRAMDEKQLAICFGKASYYAIQDGKPILFSNSNPVDMRPYESDDLEKIKKNYFWLRDYILGASLAFDLKKALEYTKKIADGVTYAEDTAVIPMLAANEKIGYMGDYVIWYEYGSGISTQVNTKWQRIIHEENQYVFGMLTADHEIYRAYKYHFCDRSQNRYAALLRKVILYPPYLGFVYKAMKLERANHRLSDADESKLIKIIDRERS